MRRRTNRRTFILFALTSSLSLYMSGWWFFKVRNNDISDMISIIISKKLDYLQVDEADIKKFAQDLQENQLNLFLTKQLSWKGMFSPLYTYTPLLDSTEVIEVFGDEVAKLFLLSTDFFWRNPNEAQHVKYVGFYSPYLRPCTNPFAKLA